MGKSLASWEARGFGRLLIGRWKMCVSSRVPWACGVLNLPSTSTVDKSLALGRKFVVVDVVCAWQQPGTDKRTRWTDWWTDRRADLKTDGRAGGQTGRRTNERADRPVAARRHADKQADRWAGRQAGGRTGRQTGNCGTAFDFWLFVCPARLTEWSLRTTFRPAVSFL